jgi:RNA polymerase sigma factor (sigma-70 family)
MVKPRWGNVLRHVQSLLDEGMLAALSDAELLKRYTGSDRESAERAFAALVDRHGPMVLRVCRTVLPDEHAAADAFQATFLVLARKAASLWVHDSIGPWLHGVAYRTSSCARIAAARRRFHERKAAELSHREVSTMETIDVGPLLHQEVERLPERFRGPIVLCYFEGLTHEQAAERLSCPVGTVRSRLATGRERLRRRLTLRGMAPEDGLPEPATSAREWMPVVPVALAQSAIRNSLLQAASASGTVPAAVAALAREELTKMTLARLRNWTLGLLVVAGGTSAGFLALAQRPEQSGKPEPPKPIAAAPLDGPARQILEARIATAREILDMVLEMIKTPQPRKVPGMMEDDYAHWSRRLLEDRLRLAANRNQRLEAIREHRDRMIVLVFVMDAAVKAERAGPAEAAKARYFRLEADQFLADEGIDPKQERPTVDPVKVLGGDETKPAPR